MTTKKFFKSICSMLVSLSLDQSVKDRAETWSWTQRWIWGRRLRFQKKRLIEADWNIKIVVVHLSWFADHPSLDTTQVTIDLPGCKSKLIAHVELFIHQNTSSPSPLGYSKWFLLPVLLQLRIALTQLQYLALGLVKPHYVHTGPLFELVCVPLMAFLPSVISPLGLVLPANLLRL